MAETARYSLTVSTVNLPLNVRQYPGLSGPVVGSLPIGTVVDGYEVKSVGDYTWYRIDAGWIAGKHNINGTILARVTDLGPPPQDTVEPTPPATESSEETVVNDEGVRSVAGGGIDQKYIDALAKESLAFTNKNKIDGSVRLFGIPHQFTAKTDIRANSTLDLGRKYLETVISEAPIVTIIPGRPNYLPDVSAKEKTLITQFFDQLTESAGEKVDPSLLNSIFNDKDKEVRYFTFVWDYFNYMKFVNLLCGVSSIMLGLTDPEIHGFEEGGVLTPYYKYDWKKYKFSNAAKYTGLDKRSGVFATQAEEPTKDDNKMFDEYFGDLTGTNPDYIQVYFDPSTSFNENASNSTAASKIVGMLEQAEGMVKEWSFLSNAASMNTMDPTQYKEAMDGFKNKLSNGDNFLTRLMSMGSVVLSGANLVFPEIWSDSSYSKSYSVTMNLVSPYGTPEAIFLNIFVPMMHIVALALPRQNTPNSFRSPFLVKAFARGMFNCEMGIVDSVSIEKGGSGDAWSVNGLPTEVRVTLSIRDLYSNMSMTSERDVMMFFQNQSLMEFLATTCGIDLVKPELKLKIDLIRNLAFNYFTELPRTTYENIATAIRNNIFLKFKDFTTFSRGG